MCSWDIAASQQSCLQYLQNLSFNTESEVHISKRGLLVSPKKGKPHYQQCARAERKHLEHTSPWQGQPWKIWWRTQQSGALQNSTILSISMRAVIRYNSERVQMEADPKLNRSFSMRHKVDFRSFQYLSSPDESQDRKGLAVLMLLSLLVGGADQADLSSLVEEAVTWVLLLSCAKSLLAAVSIPPETAETASILAA